MASCNWRLKLRAGDSGTSSGGERTMLDRLEANALDTLDRDSADIVRAILADPGACIRELPTDGGAKFKVGAAGGLRAEEVGAGILRAVVGVAGGGIADADEVDGLLACADVALVVALEAKGVAATELPALELETLRELSRGAVGVGRASLAGDDARPSALILATEVRPETVAPVAEGRFVVVAGVGARERVVLVGLETAARDTGRATGFTGGAIGVGDCHSQLISTQSSMIRSESTHLSSIWRVTIQQQSNL